MDKKWLIFLYGQNLENFAPLKIWEKNKRAQLDEVFQFINYDIILTKLENHAFWQNSSTDTQLKTYWYITLPNKKISLWKCFQVDLLYLYQ